MLTLFASRRSSTLFHPADRQHLGKRRLSLSAIPDNVPLYSLSAERAVRLVDVTPLVSTYARSARSSRTSLPARSLHTVTYIYCPTRLRSSCSEIRLLASSLSNEGSPPEPHPCTLQPRISSTSTLPITLFLHCRRVLVTFHSAHRSRAFLSKLSTLPPFRFLQRLRQLWSRSGHCLREAVVWPRISYRFCSTPIDGIQLSTPPTRAPLVVRAHSQGMSHPASSPPTTYSCLLPHLYYRPLVT